MAKVELKKPIVEEISANLECAACVVLVDPVGLTVEQDTQLRKQMRAEGIVYKVYKNTMLNFAVKGTEFEPLAQHLAGPSAIAVSKTDATAPARILAEFAKKADKLWKELIMMQRVCLLSLQFRPEKCFWEDCLEACRARSQTSRVCLIRSRRNRTRKKQTGCLAEAA